MRINVPDTVEEGAYVSMRGCRNSKVTTAGIYKHIHLDKENIHISNWKTNHLHVNKTSYFISFFKAILWKTLG